MSFVAWFYSFFFWHCIVVVCPPTVEMSDANCSWTYDGAALQDWEGELMTGVRGFEEESLRRFPFVRQFRCEAR